MGILYYVVLDGAESLGARQAAPLQGVSVTGLIRDAVAQYTVVQTYVNPLKDLAIEATYQFPLYEGVAVAGFEAEVDGRKIVGRVRERVAAREEYDEAVRAGKVASLLEQEAPDVFQASVGNIPQGKTVSIRITLVSEIKQDGEENQIRFVLPTTIAPRYGRGYPKPAFGSSSSNVSSKLSVDISCAMAKPITSIQSPSHTIQVHLGASAAGITSDSAQSISFDPNRARVSLTTDSLLDRDLVIVVQSVGLDQPRALVERHPTDGTHAISLTFSPRFALQPLRASELIFLVDRSGSMGGTQIEQAGEALELFLRSVPFENHYFNVIGFGSGHRALFPISTEYNAESLKTAVQYAQTIQADMGGTEIASAFQEVFRCRRRNMLTQVFLLTDGQIWDVDALARSISDAVEEGERSKSPLRVFSLGVGDSVSHHLIESVARAGNGYAQIVTAGERMEKKVLNMLKAGLSPPVTNAGVQWSENLDLQSKIVDSKDDDFIMVEEDDEDYEDKNAHKPLIDLYSASPLVVSPPSAPSSSPPNIAIAIHQAPFKMPVLCRGARFTVYAILSARATVPKELVLRGSSPDGPVELRVKIESVAEGETMLHSLAARSLVRDLEEGSSFVHALGKTLTPQNEELLKRLGVHVVLEGKNPRKSVLPLSFNDVFEITKDKIIAIALKYNLSTKYTSWIAIDEESRNTLDTPQRTYCVTVPCKPVVRQQRGLFGGPAQGHPVRRCLAMTSSSAAFGSHQKRDIKLPQKFGAQARSRENVASFQPFFQASTQLQMSSGLGFGAQARGQSFAAFGAPDSVQPSTDALFGCQPHAFQSRKQQQLSQQQQPIQFVDDRLETVPSDDPHSRLRALLQHQSFDGSFSLVPAIAALFSTTIEVLKTKLKTLREQCTGSVELTEAEWETVWATCLAVAFMRDELNELQEEWELVVEKAEQRVESLLKNSEHVGAFNKSASEVGV